MVKVMNPQGMCETLAQVFSAKLQAEVAHEIQTKEGIHSQKNSSK